MVALCVIVALRNYCGAYMHIRKIHLVFFLVAGTAISYMVNNNGWLGIIPIFCYIDYTIAIMYTEKPQIIRYILLANNVLYAIFDIGIMLYVNFAFDVFHIVTGAVAIVTNRPRKGDVR